MKRLIVVLALAALAAVPAAAEVTSNVRVDISGSIANPCNGEIVNFAGTAHYVFRTTVDANGGLHVGVNANAQVKGTGATTGAKYVANEQLHQQINLAGAGTTTLVHNLALKGQGQVPNFVLMERVHVTVNANGEVTVDRTESSSECR
jgi:hypothetical protein